MYETRTHKSFIHTVLLLLLLRVKTVPLLRVTSTDAETDFRQNSFILRLCKKFVTRAQQLMRWATAQEQMGDRARAKWAKKWRGEAAVLLSVGEGKLVPHLTQCHLGRGLSVYQVVSRLGHKRHGIKSGEAAVLLSTGRAGSPSHNVALDEVV